jgi:general stress protein CsbA
MDHYMLYPIVALMLVLWLAGLLSGYTMGGFIYVLPVIAVLMVLANFLSRRKQERNAK